MAEKESKPKRKTKRRQKAKNRKKKTASSLTLRTKDILKFLGGGTILTATFAFPLLPLVAAPLASPRKRFDWDAYQKEWEKFNPWRLRQALTRLHEQKMVEIVEEDDIPVVKLTKKGKLKLLKYKLEEMELKKPHRWDKKWRIVIYDVPKEKNNAARAFRSLLQQLKFLRLQKSVYLTPFPCEDEINYLRELFDIGENVALLIVASLENADPYRRYFGI